MIPSHWPAEGWIFLKEANPIAVGPLISNPHPGNKLKVSYFSPCTALVT